MSCHATLPVEIRLKIYEIHLADCFDAPALCRFPIRNQDRNFFRAGRPSERYYMLVHGWKTWENLWGLAQHNVRDAKIKLPVPPSLQAELGGVRSHLLEWLARQKDVSPHESTPVLKFPDRVYLPENDFLYLDDPDQIHALSYLLGLIREIPGERSVEFARRIRRVALVASMRHAISLPLLLKRLDMLPGLEELAFAFVELEHGKLEVITSVAKKNYAAYSLEPLSDSDIEPHHRKLGEAIRELEPTIRPMLGRHAENLKITACKMILRI